MGSSLSNETIRAYFIDAHLKRYVSKGTELVVVVSDDNEKGTLNVHVNVIRKDGQMVQLSSELRLDKNNWPRPSKELIAQVMMVG